MAKMYLIAESELELVSVLSAIGGCGVIVAAGCGGALAALAPLREVGDFLVVALAVIMMVSMGVFIGAREARERCVRRIKSESVAR